MEGVDLRKARRAHISDFRNGRFEVVASSAQAALKSAFLVNGGGAVALLAYFGQAAKLGQIHPASAPLALSLGTLVLGTALAGIATGLSFVAQYGYFMRSRRRSWISRHARDLTAANIVLIMFSYLCFVVAGCLACWGLR